MPLRRFDVYAIRLPACAQTPALLLTLRAGTRRIVARVGLPPSTHAHYLRYDTYPYGLLLLTLLNVFGWQLSKSALVGLLGGVAFLQLLLLVNLSEAEEHARVPAPLRWVTALFMVSGFAALI